VEHLEYSLEKLIEHNGRLWSSWELSRIASRTFWNNISTFWNNIQNILEVNENSESFWKRIENSRNLWKNELIYKKVTTAD
jgi:hypothetical protein